MAKRADQKPKGSRKPERGSSGAGTGPKRRTTRSDGTPRLQQKTASAGEPSRSAESEAGSESGWCSTPAGIRLSRGGLTIDAEDAQVERGGLKAHVSVRRGEDLLYAERVNFDWSGGRDKFLRQAARALAAARATTQSVLTEALVIEMGKVLRTRREQLPTDLSAEIDRRAARRLADRLTDPGPSGDEPARGRRAPHPRA